MSITEKYRARTMSAAEAAALVPDGAKMVVGLGVSYPPALMDALAVRVRSGDLTGGTLYCMLACAAASESILAPDLHDRIRHVSLFHGGVERGNDALRAGSAQGLVETLPVQFHQIPRILTEHLRVDTLFVTVSPMDADAASAWAPTPITH
ncbi:hypothetical protein [Sphingobium fuliginis]|uniref:hypothetical protein n=1 Tax=Sphingobium fuliginis (strain ATCC 27551) TaxID=336203 RepID=UPI002673733F|nr:hypothetical protein [Sphingobium fuliginis]